MIRKSRNLVLDVFDYNNHKLCTLYDNSSDLSGQAYDVFVTTKRNGWRELQFNIPSTIETENGVEPNFRIDYIQADYRIRLIDDDGTDWFLITEPTFTHRGPNKDVSIKAGHISQLLKTKNLGLEFSDEEGNNVGTAEELLTTILEGTGWTVGEVTEFYEDNDPTAIKRRSLQAPSKTGAFKLISNMCDLFEAKPVFHGDTKTVDILPMNPFSEPKDGGLPDVTKADGVIELAYSHNIKNVTRRLNSENLVTKLYAYGSYGDTTDGYCGIDECSHNEHVFILSSALTANSIYYFSIVDDSGMTIYRNFTVDRNIPSGSKVTFSLLDPTSMMYVWIQSSSSSTFNDIHSTYWSDISNDNWNLIAQEIDEDANINGKAYLVTQGRIGSLLPISSTSVEIVKNWFSFVTDFEYFRDVDLLTDDGLQKLAGFQRYARACYQLTYNRALEFSKELTTLSETIGDVDFCKLDVQSITSSSNGLRIQLNKNTYEDGIIYRSDYSSNSKEHFLWKTTAEIKANGDPKTTGASMIFIIHNTNPVRWTKGYLKAMDSDTNPTYLTFHIDNYSDNYNLISTNSKFYLFGNNNINGWLGAFEINDEANLTCINNETKIVTVEHPIGFGSSVPSVTPITNDSIDDNNPSWYKIDEYGWFWKYYRNNTPSELYFCYYDHYGTGTERQFRRVYYQNTEPNTPTTYSYWYNWKTSVLSRYVSGSWVKLSSDPEKKVAKYFGAVYKACLIRDKYYKGVPQYLTYTVPSGGLSVGNYYIEDDYGTFYVFSTKEALSSGAKLSYDTNDSWIEQLTNGDLSELQANLTMEAGTINKATGELIEDMMKSRSKYYISVTPGQNYSFSGLSSAYPLTIYKYNSNHVLVDVMSGVSGFDGMFVAETGIRYIKLGSDLNYRTFNSVTGFKILIGSIKVIESKVYRFDNVNYHPDNNYDHISESGSISNTGSFLDGDDYNNDYCRTKGYIQVYPNNTYYINNGVYHKEDVSSMQPLTFTIHCYDYNKTWLYKIDSVSGVSGIFNVNSNVYYIKVVSQMPLDYDASLIDNKKWYELFDVDCQSLSIRDSLLSNAIIIQDKNYIKLSPINKHGEVKGIIALTQKFSDVADNAYITKHNALIAAQNILKELDLSMQISLGDMYREGYWQKNDYVDGDEKKLYTDALDTVKKISKPEVSYNIDYLDLYKSDTTVIDGASEQSIVLYWPDLSIISAAHLIDPEINVNCWAYIDVIQKCYDKPWQTKITINTDLSTIAQHTFTDVMTNIANVASAMKAKESIIDRATAISGSGKLAAERLEGAINTAKLKIFGGASTMYTDKNGNMVFESADGTSAMTLTGAGFAIASSKDEFGDWNWRTFGTGDGFTADEIITGYLSSVLIEAGSITTDKLTASIGEELELSSNKSINLIVDRIDDDIETAVENSFGQRMVVTFPEGNVFESEQSRSTLTAVVKVYMHGVDVTTQVDDSYFSWQRISKDTEADTTWNAMDAHIAHKNITLTRNDVGKSCVIRCTMRAFQSDDLKLSEMSADTYVFDHSIVESTHIKLADDKLEIAAYGSLEVKANADITVKNQGDLTIESGGHLNVSADSIKLSANPSSSTHTLADELSGLSTAITTTAENAFGQQMKVVFWNGTSFETERDTLYVSVYVYKDGIDVTNQVASSYFSWQRISSNSEADAIWDNNHTNTKDIILRRSDVGKSCTIRCTMQSVNITGLKLAMMYVDTLVFDHSLVKTSHITIEQDKVEIASAGHLDILANANITVKNNGNITIESGGKINVSAGDINLTSSSTTLDHELSGLDGRIHDAEVKITPEAIVSTVRSSQTYQDDLDAKVAKSEFTSQISQHADSIISTVTSSQTMSNLLDAKADVTDLDAKADAADYVAKSEFTSQISQHADSIVSTVTNSETMSTLLNGKANKSTVETMQTQINQKADGIQFSAIKTRVENLSVGGTNLLSDSERNRSANRFVSINVRDILKDHVGEEICVSFEIKGTISRVFQVYAYQQSGISMGDTEFFTMPTTDFQRFSFVTTVTNYGQQSGLSTGEIAWYDSVGSNPFTVRRIKIELGNTPTDWTPSPDDPVETLENSTLTINTDGISMTSTGSLEFQAGGSFQVFAQDETNSYIKFGGTEKNPNFSLGSGGTVIANKIITKDIEVDGTSGSIMTMMPGSMATRAIVSTTQPTGHQLLWIQPSGGGGGSTDSVTFACSPSGSSADMTNWNASKTYGMTRREQSGISSSQTNCLYGVKFSIYNYGRDCYIEAVNVSISPNSNGSNGYTIYSKQYDYTTNVLVSHVGETLEVNTLNSLVECPNITNSTIYITISVTKVYNNNVSMQFSAGKDITLYCVGNGSPTLQSCNLYYIP